METRQFNVTGMSCAACSSRVEKAVCALRGVSAAEVNLLTNSLKATFDEGVLGVEDIERAVEDAGTGRPAIGPIESHMRGASSAKDQMRRTRTASAAASASASGAVAAAVLPRPAKPFSLAP